MKNTQSPPVHCTSMASPSNDFLQKTLQALNFNNDNGVELDRLHITHNMVKIKKFYSMVFVVSSQIAN